MTPWGTTNSCPPRPRHRCCWSWTSGTRYRPRRQSKWSNASGSCLPDDSVSHGPRWYNEARRSIGFIWGFPNNGVPELDGFLRENPLENGWELGVPPFMETAIWLYAGYCWIVDSAVFYSSSSSSHNGDKWKFLNLVCSFCSLESVRIHWSKGGRLMAGGWVPGSLRPRVNRTQKWPKQWPLLGMSWRRWMEELQKREPNVWKSLTTFSQDMVLLCVAKIQDAHEFTMVLLILSPIRNANHAVHHFNAPCLCAQKYLKSSIQQ